jgi:hypothetical protein
VFSGGLALLACLAVPIRFPGSNRHLKRTGGAGSRRTEPPFGRTDLGRKPEGTRMQTPRPMPGIGLEIWGLGFGVSAKRPFHEGLISTSPFPLSTSSFVLKSCLSKYAPVFVGTHVELCRDLRQHARLRLNLNLNLSLNLALNLNLFLPQLPPPRGNCVLARCRTLHMDSRQPAPSLPWQSVNAGGRQGLTRGATHGLAHGPTRSLIHDRTSGPTNSPTHGSTHGPAHIGLHSGPRVSNHGGHHRFAHGSHHGIGHCTHHGRHHGIGHGTGHGIGHSRHQGASHGGNDDLAHHVSHDPYPRIIRDPTGFNLKRAGTLRLVVTSC